MESELQQELEQRMKRNKAPRSIQGYSLREKEENASEDEEDDYSYQEYLLKLVREVQALLAQARTETMQEGGRTLGKEGAGHKFGATAAEGIELEQGDGGLDAKLQVGGRRVQGAAEPPMALGGPAGSQPANLDFKANHEGNQLAAPLQLGSGKGSDGLGVRKGAECAPSSAEGMCIAYEAESSANIEN